MAEKAPTYLALYANHDDTAGPTRFRADGHLFSWDAPRKTLTKGTTYFIWAVNL